MVIWRLVRATGRVQGVFYRDSARREAQRLGLTGWVKNMPDRSVDARLEGPLQQIEEMVRWMREGPPLAQVEAVTVLTEGVGSKYREFVVRH